MRMYIMGLVLLLSIASCKKEETTYIIETDLGNMKVKLLDSAPKHKANFIKLVSEGFYNGLLFHRVVNGAIIQGGDPDSRNAQPGQHLGVGDVGYKIPSEIGVPHFKGMLAAARQGADDNPNLESSGSQFYIVQGQQVSEKDLNIYQSIRNFKYSQAQIDKYLRLGGMPMLDQHYTVFGEVTEGLDVLDKIARQQTDDYERPLKDIHMQIFKDNSN